jgi:hypothetical protein
MQGQALLGFPYKFSHASLNVLLGYSQEIEVGHKIGAVAAVLKLYKNKP